MTKAFSNQSNILSLPRSRLPSSLIHIKLYSKTTSTFVFEFYSLPFQIQFILCSNCSLEFFKVSLYVSTQTSLQYINSLFLEFLWKLEFVNQIFHPTGGKCCHENAVICVMSSSMTTAYSELSYLKTVS